MDREELLRAQLRDGRKIARRRPWFLGFLTPEEAAFCEDELRREREVLSQLWGGYEDAERKLLGLFPEYMEPEESSFPLAAVTFRFREADKLSHRDLLGSFMALGVERDVIGDILVGKDKAVAFFREEMTRYFLDNITKVGRAGVKAVSGIDGDLPLEKSFRVIRGVTASARLDCLVALLCKTSREKAAGLITGGMVSRNHREILSGSSRVEEGDRITVRGSGKFIIDRLGPETAKGRLSVECRKYQ